MSSRLILTSHLKQSVWCFSSHIIQVGFPGGTVVKYSSVNAGDKRDVGSVPGSGDSLEKEMSTHPSILAWKISWTEEPGEL